VVFKIQKLQKNGGQFKENELWFETIVHVQDANYFEKFLSRDINKTKL